VRRPIPGRQLFRDQAVGGRIIGNSQQRFGYAHEGNAFLIRQAEFLQEGIQKRALVAPRTRALNEGHGGCHGAMSRSAGEFQRMQQPRHRLVL
jgi:hypothetical protein